MATSTGRYLQHKRQNLRSLNTRSLFMYWRRSVKGIEVAKAGLAAKPIVAKPNVDCISTSIKNSRVLQCNQIGFRSYLTTLICILEIGLLKCHSLIIRERVDCSTRMTLDWFIHGPICYFQEFNLSCKSGRLGWLIDWLHFHKLTFRRQNFRANVLLSQFFLVQIWDNWCLATTASH